MWPEVEAKTNPTRQLLLDAAVELLDSHKRESITVELLLNKCGASRSSLYHHFEDMNDLIAAAELYRVSQAFEFVINLVEKILQSNGSVTEVLGAVQNELNKTELVNPIKIRNLMILGQARAIESEKFALALGRQQEQLSQSITETIKLGQSQNLFDPSKDPYALGVFLQALFLGRFVVQFAATELTEDVWYTLINEIMLNALSPKKISE